jgi:hypothetical protein
MIVAFLLILSVFVLAMTALGLAFVHLWVLQPASDRVAPYEKGSRQAFF